MKEIRYWVAEDGKKFEDKYECLDYEQQKMFGEVREEFVFLNHRKIPIAIENARTEDVDYIIIKTDRAAEVIGQWFEDNCCVNPFDRVYENCIGTWVYGDIFDKDDEWIKLELVIEQLQTLIKELNKGAE